ncbi:hypothetical protein J6590_040803 [Homalodisca vitripennis]|nr:hypothetical protein J6590_040803 [Homalodisca vitripennis]
MHRTERSLRTQPEYDITAGFGDGLPQIVEQCHNSMVVVVTDDLANNIAFISYSSLSAPVEEILLLFSSLIPPSSSSASILFFSQTNPDISPNILLLVFLQRFLQIQQQEYSTS